MATTKKKKTVKLTVTFANIPADATHPQIQRGFDVASHGTDVLFTVEDHKRNSAAFMPSGWTTIQAHGAHGRCSIHLRTTRFRVNGQGTPLVNRANGMKFPGAERFGCFCKAQDQWSGRHLNLASLHLVPHADMANRPGVITDMPRGKANVRPAINAITRQILPVSLVGQELGGIDANIDLDSDLRIRDGGMVEQLRKVGLVTDVQALKSPVPDTHHGMEYDWLFGRFTKGAVRWVEPNTTLAKLPGLDHRFRRGVIELTVRRGFPA